MVAALTLVSGVVIGVASAPAALQESSRRPSASPPSSTSTTTTQGPTSNTTTTLVPVTTTTVSAPSNSVLPWPQQGSAAVAIPQLSVVATSPRQSRVPIASLTKMMTTWVVLHRRPLNFNQQGPCLSVNSHDVALWDYDVSSGQSNAEIRLGETLCEGTLLRGLLVHSAGNYAQLLARLVGLGTNKFVALMNKDAVTLGLRQTHYADYSGISPLNVSTARDQATMAIDLMNAEPIVRQIVALPYVTLPVAGVVASYTPDIGQFGVIGVKSGYTPAAGGCDIMAIKVTVNQTVFTTYAVVLGQFSANPLGLAGQAALALSRKLRALMRVVRTPGGRSVQWTGPSVDITPTTTTTSTTTTTVTTTTTTTASTTTTPSVVPADKFG